MRQFIRTSKIVVGVMKGVRTKKELRAQVYMYLFTYPPDDVFICLHT